MMEIPPRKQDSAESLSEVWAKKYVENLLQFDSQEDLTQLDRAAVAKLLPENLRSISAQAWTKTELFLADEVRRHGIDYGLVDPWAIAQDVHQVYAKTLAIYADGEKPARLSVEIAQDMGEIRNKYTNQESRLISYISMQFHFTGQLLLKLPLPSAEAAYLADFFKVVDDNLYMPLKRAYDAAAQHDYSSPLLQAVRSLLPHITPIAQVICRNVALANPKAASLNGPLQNEEIQISSVRDVEMFQIYLCVCVLEEGISILQQELFPICMMLYPALQVRWNWVREWCFAWKSSCANAYCQLLLPFFNLI
ncbi:MAG: hypothetical protein HC890_18935 [Chloroflexaceae bacterium]|nr:hypothetical protein [Chloroflexaceae bacterium]